MDFAQELRERDEALNRIIAEEEAHPLHGRHFARWTRIKEIHQQCDELWKYKPERKRQKGEPEFYETVEWKLLTDELKLLHSIERTQAASAGWPIWQRGQHFKYVDKHQTLREGEVRAFDLDNDTIECSTWALNDFLGYVTTKDRLLCTIRLEQIYEGIKREQELEQERIRAKEESRLAAERNRHPLFANQI